MGVKASYTEQSLNEYFSAVLSIIREETIRTLSYLGEQSVTRIRDRSSTESWIDHTGNLRTSIGYAVTSYGKKQIESVFQQVLDGTEGAEAGKKLIDELVGKYANTYALIVVAGMNYADYVESLENKDVLASTELWAKSVINKYMETTQKRILTKVGKLKL